MAFLLSWFGASIFGFSPEQRFLLMTGIGRNGKGALKHAIMKAVGDYGVQPDANVYMRTKYGAVSSDRPRADLMALKGKRVGFFSEPEGGKFNEEVLKAHTGGDMITARALNSNNVMSWEATHSITFLVNDAPEIDDLGPSMGARVMVADFRERYDGEREDKQLYGKLVKEADGILAILCFCAKEWYTRWKAGEGGLVIPQRVIDQSKQFMERNDPVARCIDEAFYTGQSETGAARLCYEAYIQWHTRANEDGEPMSNVRFAGILEKKGFKKVKRPSGLFYNGLRPKSIMDTLGEEDDD
jgi:putative DNA primase/helicase